MGQARPELNKINSKKSKAEESSKVSLSFFYTNENCIRLADHEIKGYPQ